MNHQKQNYAVKLLKAMANANRLKMLDILVNAAKEPLNVTAIVEKMEIPQSIVSNHLARMRVDGLVQAKQVGLNMFYYIKDENVVNVLKAIK
jgi:ArsR family transcriptional regulator